MMGEKKFICFLMLLFSTELIADNFLFDSF